jgi:hypothetical protein
MRVTNGIPLGCPLFLPVHTVNSVQTLKVVFSADNGGYLSGGDGDDTPRRGGKFGDFEGGTRVNSFISGGVVPVGARYARLSTGFCSSPPPCH